MLYTKSRKPRNFRSRKPTLKIQTEQNLPKTVPITEAQKTPYQQPDFLAQLPSEQLTQLVKDVSKQMGTESLEHNILATTAAAVLAECAELHPNRNLTFLFKGYKITVEQENKSNIQNF